MTLVALGLLVLVPQQGNPPAQGSDIWDKLKFEADGRMRAEATIENIDGNGDSVDDRFRGRMRFRFGAKYQLEENMLLGMRLSTASDATGGNETDANNPHWDWGDGDGFSGGGIVFDRYFVDWTANEELHVVFGKQQHAFTTPPIFGDFLWDSDISPAGITATWKPKPKQDTSFDARAAVYIAAENSTDHDAKMIGAQGNLYTSIDKAKTQLSSAIYGWTNVNSINPGVFVTTNQGNDDTNFTVWDNFASATLPGGPLDEMTGYAELMLNVEKGEEGIVLGGQLGSSKWQRGNYNAFLLFYDLDENAVYSPVAQDDTPVPGTGLNPPNAGGQHGWVLGGQYFWRDTIAFKLWVLTSNADNAEDDPIRIRLDMDFKVK